MPKITLSIPDTEDEYDGPISTPTISNTEITINDASAENNLIIPDFGEDFDLRHVNGAPIINANVSINLI